MNETNSTVKKLISLSLIFALLISSFSVLPLSASAAEIGTEFTSDKLIYTVTSENTVELTSVEEGLTDITIPESVSYDGVEYTVTSIKSSTITIFKNSIDTLVSLSIPGTVKKVPYHLCYYCQALKTVTLNEGIEEIEDSAFSETGIEKVDLPTTLKSLGISAFFLCEELKEVRINSDIKLESGVDSPFRGCDALAVVYCNSKNIEMRKDGKYFSCPNPVNFVMYVYSGTQAEEHSIYKNYSTRYIELIGQGPQKRETFTVGDLTYQVGNRKPVDEIAPAVVDSCAAGITKVEIPSTITYEGVEFTVNQFSSGAFKNAAETLTEVYFYSDTVSLFFDPFWRYFDLTKLTFYGNSGSTAEAFAKENNIKFLSLDGSELPTDATEPTTTEPTPPEPTTTVPSTTPEPTTTPADHEPTVPGTTAPSDDLLIGDVDGNGKLDIRDATYIQKHLVKYTDSNGQPLIDESDSRQFKIADFNGDNKIDVNDVTDIQKRLVKLI